MTVTESGLTQPNIGLSVMKTVVSRPTLLVIHGA